ncbi:MAG: PHB depolymerase family esterase [Pseudomonadota bacterium]
MALVSCSSSSPDNSGFGKSGGSTGAGTGGASTTGGATGSGGTAATGGSTGSGGAATTGGSTGSGGAPATGGGAGGGSATGGAPIGGGNGGGAAGGRGGSATGGSAGGSAGGSNGGAGGGAPSVASAGCGKTAPAGSGPMQGNNYVPFTITVPGVAANATTRKYYVRTPTDYNPNRPGGYRTIYLGPGCGPVQDLNPNTRKTFALNTATGFDAILIALEPGLYNVSDYSATEYCFDDMVANSVEYPYFDALHKAIEANYCVDTARQFFAGYSSGGWVQHQLGCAFPDVLRAHAGVTGGLPPSIASNPANMTASQKACVNKPIAAMFIHDRNDQSNVYAGSLAGAQRVFRLNGCTGTFPTTAAGIGMPGVGTLPAGQAAYTIPGVANSATFGCVQFTGCPAAYPLVFCSSTNQMHNSQAASAVPGFWDFFSKF